MKAPRLVTVALVGIAFAGVAQAGPKSPLYLTTQSPNISVVQGNGVINSFPEAYDSPNEFVIAVWGDVRTTSAAGGTVGGQYSLGGVPTGTMYILPTVINLAYDSTSDGSHNYVVDNVTGTVYQTARDFTNAVALFNVGNGHLGITYDATNSSLWIANWGLGGGGTIADYSMNGTLLSSFNTGHDNNGALALDPADHTLWLSDDDPFSLDYGYLEGFSTAGVFLGAGPFVGGLTVGGEFNLEPAPTTPEPSTLIMFGSGFLGLTGLLRRKLNL